MQLWLRHYVRAIYILAPSAFAADCLGWHADSSMPLQVRTRNFDPQLDLGAYGSLQLRVRGNGLRFKCIIRTDTNWDGIAYCS